MLRACEAGALIYSVHDPGSEAYCLNDFIEILLLSSVNAAPCAQPLILTHCYDHQNPIAQTSTMCRPVAMGPGGTDQLAHALGETRVSLGANMVAVAQLQQPLLRGPQPAAVPAEDPSAEQDVVVFFGIIDILQASLALAMSGNQSWVTLSHDGTA